MNLYKVTFWDFLFTEEALFNVFIVAETEEAVKIEYTNFERIQLIQKDIRILK